MLKNKILIVEDCEVYQTTMKTLLKYHDVALTSSAVEAIRIINTHTYDLIIIDIILPDGNGFEVSKQIRESKQNCYTPILFLSVKTEASEKLLGFENGADDYVCKPFNHLELRARIDALLRRTQKTKNKTTITFGPIELNQSKMSVHVHQDDSVTEVKLTSSEFKLLSYFIRNPNQIISRDEIKFEVWAQGNRKITARSIDAKISLVRNKLRPFGQMLHCVYGEGYVFTLRHIEGSAVENE